MLGIGIKVRMVVFILLVGRRKLFILEYELIPTSPSSPIMRKSPKRNNFSFSKLQSWFPISFLLPTSCFLLAVSTFASCIIPSLSSKPVFMLSKDLPPPLTLGLLFCQSSLQLLIPFPASSHFSHSVTQEGSLCGKMNESQAKLALYKVKNKV